MNPLFLPALCGLVLVSSPAAQQLVISEFAADNDNGLSDEDGQETDWIEIQNVSGTAVDLLGWSLTDDRAVPSRWVFPSRVVPPGGFLVLFASGKDRLGAELHTNFGLAAAGEYLALTRPSGTIEWEYAPEYPVQFTDVSYGIDGRYVQLLGSLRRARELVGYFSEPTPGARNGRITAALPPVQFSVKRGFHDAPFQLSLTVDAQDAFIVYTLDGTEPSVTNGVVYSGPLSIDTTSFVRAIGLSVGRDVLTRSVTSTYIFPSDVLAQSDASAIASGFPASWLEQNGTNWTQGNSGTHPGAWYGLDQVLLGQHSEQELIDSLEAVPSISLVMPLEDWFSTTPPYGIYPNSLRSGPAWERPCSAEFIDPTGGPEFQINCKVGVQGGSGTDASNRSQLSLKLKFSRDVGPRKLKFPLFEGSPVERFDYILLDGGNQNSVHSNVNLATKVHAQGLRDQFMMDTLLDMGREGAQGRHVQVFLNGLYWGLYNLHERPNHNWAAELLGGDPDEYDFVKVGGVLHGNSNNIFGNPPGAWRIVEDIEAGGLADGVMYQGRPAYEALQEYVDLANYSDYMLLNFYGGNEDWPQKNWMATARARIGPSLFDENPDLQFRFHSWDAEVTVPWGPTVTAVGGFYDRTTQLTQNPANVAFLYTELRAHSEYPLFIADRFQKHFSPGGALHVDPAYTAQGTPYDPGSPERNASATRYYRLSQSIEQAVLMEYLRWGNYFHSPGDVGIDDWVVERERILEEFCSIRSNVLRAQLRNSGLYPSFDAPTFAQHGGSVVSGFCVTITTPAGSIYYTEDGSDPRLPGGAISPAAILYGAPPKLGQTTTIRARGLDGGEWSALVEATFSVEVQLSINELCPDNDSILADEAGQYEDYVELHNDSDFAVDAGGMYLTDDLNDPTQWQLPAGTVVPARGQLLIWADSDLLDGPLHAPFSLSKTGEEVGLFHTDAEGNVPIDTVVFGPISTDQSIGRLRDGSSKLVRLVDPSPGATNLPAQGSVFRYDALDPLLNSLGLGISMGTVNLGQTLEFTVAGALPNTGGMLALGSDTVTLPYAGGVLLCTLDLPSQSFTTDAAGTGVVTLTIPMDPVLVGLSVFGQAVVGSDLSNGLSMTTGP